MGSATGRRRKVRVALWYDETDKAAAAQNDRVTLWQDEPDVAAAKVAPHSTLPIWSVAQQNIFQNEEGVGLPSEDDSDGILKGKCMIWKTIKNSLNRQKKGRR